MGSSGTAVDGCVLDLVLPSGGRVRTTWQAPTAEGPGRGWAWVQHGFARRAERFRGLAALLSASGFAVVSPDVPSWRRRRSLHDAPWLTEVALTIARAVESGVPQARGVHGEGAWSLVGHSAGAAVTAHAAACLAARTGGETVRSLILLDPVDTAGGLLRDALPGIEAPGEVHACRPSACNREGASVAMLSLRGWPVTRHDGLAHPDPERIPPRLQADAVAPASAWLARLCGPPGADTAVLALARQVRDSLVGGAL